MRCGHTAITRTLCGGTHRPVHRGHPPTALARTASLAVLLLAAAVPSIASQPTYPDRWVHVTCWPHADADVEHVRQIADAASANGFTGLLLDAGLDCLDTQDAAYLARVQQVRRLCEQRGLEVVPLIFSVGYGHAALRHDRNLAEGVPVTNALFTVQGGEARLTPDPPVTVPNGDFGAVRLGDEFADLGYQENPGAITFVDRDTVHAGEASLRCQDIPEHSAGGKARVAWTIPVRPRAQYRVSLWVKTDALQPSSAFSVQAHGDQGILDSVNPVREATTDWTRVVFAFNSRQNTRLSLWAGAWGAQGGRFWLDDVRIEELGLRRVIRREGAPLVVTREDGDLTCEEGRDFEPIRDPRLADVTGDGDDPPIRLAPDSRIREGERLRVSFYHTAVISWKSQVPLCMSNPELYALWRKQAHLLREVLAARSYFLDMDEIRAGGTCAACRARGVGMDEILGGCITKQAEILRETTPGANVYIWSDMLDPEHNAHAGFYLVDGDLRDAWRHVPQDLVIACWGRHEALTFFAERGFATAAGICCDGGNVEHMQAWLAALARTPRARGAVYVTWANDYALLPQLGQALAPR